MGQFCDAGFIATFTKTQLYIYKNGTIILQGKQDLYNGMWYVNLVDQGPVTMSPEIQKTILGNPHEANSVYETIKKKDIITFLSQAMWNPVPATWIKAINAVFFATWPGLTAKLVREYLDDQPATVKGHMRANRANVRSTKKA